MQNGDTRLVWGFTLIELLVVLGIIGLLAALMLNIFGASRRAARDDRRIADLRQVEQDIELFKHKCGFYPGSYTSNEECSGALGSDPNKSLNNPSDWTDLENKLKRAQVVVETIPYDPTSSGIYEYKYRVQLEDRGAQILKGQCFVLMANLETKHKALNDPYPNELDGNPPGNPPLQNLFPGSTDCGDSVNDAVYCIGNRDCFLGS